LTILFSPKLFFGKNVVIIARPIIRASRGAEQIVNARENRTLFEVINGRGQIVSANDFFFSHLLYLWKSKKQSRACDSFLSLLYRNLVGC
jgi:hypothetical protein